MASAVDCGQCFYVCTCDASAEVPSMQIFSFTSSIKRAERCWILNKFWNISQFETNIKTRLVLLVWDN